MTEPTRFPDPAAVRLIFEYEGDQVRLVQQQPVDVAVSGFDLTREQAPGDHVEVRGADGQLLNRVPIRSGMTTSVEVFPEDPNEPITRTDMPEARGAFTVVVPTTPQADHIALVRIQPGDTEAGALGDRSTSPVPGAPEIIELATFPLNTGGGR